MILVAVAISCSLGMSLPISTPPNAMAHAMGEIETRYMFRAGIVVGGVGLVALYLLIFILIRVGFL